jgi:predicted DNA-binding transcriptional regulator AlpA
MEQNFQLKIEIPENFKEEIIKGVVEQIKYLFETKKTNNTNTLLSRSDTAKTLNISLVKLWQLTKDKAFPVYKIGGKVLYKKEEIENFINVKSS